MKYKNLFIILILLASCELPGSVDRGRIKIKNDSQDKKFNILQVYGSGSAFSLKPGESRLLPEGTKNFSLRRDYESYSRSYSVECPDFKSDSSGITVKMIDVHTNRIAGGCRTVSADKY